ncbi:TPA: GTP-binding protein [Candidatus Geothermarchaeota archaeon]|nr:GTP-binding protein [Candidatus Geothermarchaeota archaeon]
MNPWERIKPPLKTDDIEEIGFRKASREANKIPYKSKIETPKRREMIRVKILYKFIHMNLSRSLRILDAYFEAHQFYKDLIRIYFPENEIKRIHKRIYNLIRTLEDIKNEYIDKINNTYSPEDMKKFRRVAQGKFATFLRRIKSDIEFVIDLHRYASRLPSIDVETMTFLVAGPPNTGKSTLVNVLSSAKIKTAEYPFTTKNIHVGHIQYRYLNAQIIDTPGLLDRSLNERNEIELKAIYALKNLAGDILYMFDVSNNAYYPISNQINIYREIQREFNDRYIIPIANKIDSIDKDKIIELEMNFGDELFSISCIKREGIDRLRRFLTERMEKYYLERVRR